MTRVLYMWERVRASLWFVPAWMSLAAAALALVSGRLDETLASQGESLRFVYPGDRDGARALLSTVAGSMITVAGVTFSVTIVALSLASSQFGPRLLLNFMRDRGNQLVLGTFIATFVFCLLALGQGGRDPEAVPAISATVGLALAIASLAVLIYFIHHVSSSIRAEQVIDVVARDLAHAVDRLFPRADAGDRGTDAATLPEPEFRDAPAVSAPWDGYVQTVDEGCLVSIAAEEDLVLKTLRRPGHFVVEGEPLVLAAGRQEIPQPVTERIQGCFILGRQRTHDQDPEYRIHQLVEVAVRALSPGVNDPYTALSCVDWLGAVLSKVGDRRFRGPQRLDSGGSLRLIVDSITFEGMLAAAFNQIRQCAQVTAAVSIRMLETLAQIGRCAIDEGRRTAVRAQADMVFHGAQPEKLQECDRRDLESRYRAVIDELEKPIAHPIHAAREAIPAARPANAAGAAIGRLSR